MPTFIARAACWLLALTIAAPALCATSSSLRSAIIQRETAMNAALAANDAEHYFAFLAPEMSGIFYDETFALPAYRKSWSDAFDAGRRIRTVKLGDIIVLQLPCNQAAVAQYTVDLTVDHPDGDISTEHAFQTDVWIKRKGEWQLLHAHFGVATPAAH